MTYCEALADPAGLIVVYRVALAASAMPAYDGPFRRMAQNDAATREIERQGRWKQRGGMVGRYTRGESAGSALRYL